MSFATQSTPAAVTHATTFLTQPLFTIYPHEKVSSLQLVLRSTLTSAFLSSSPNALTLSLSPATPPPRVIHAACIAANLPWSDWIVVLGGNTFELHLLPSCVSIKMPDGRTASVWEDPLSQPTSQSNHLWASRLSLKRRTRPPTLAQQLLESKHEDKEADEMFAMLSKCDISIVSPTPTRGTFCPSPFRPTFDTFLPSSPKLAQPVHVISFRDALSESDLDSRPSSRSSNASAFSLSSFASCSASSVSSAPSVRSSPSPSPARQHKEETRVIVDVSKTTPTRYTYSGGVSTVLTGGVMLGAPRASPSSKKPVAAASTMAHGNGKTNGIWKPRAKMAASQEATGWRRGVEAAWA